MNERPWQSNLWRSIHEIPHVDPHMTVAAYLMFEDGHVIRGALFQGSHEGCTSTYAGTKDLQVLPGVVKWQPIMGKTAAMAPTPESKVNVNPPKEDELPIEEQIFNDLDNEETRWGPMHKLDPNDPGAVWILTTHGNVEKAYPFRDEKGRLYWGPDEGCRLRAVAWAATFDHIDYCPELLHAKPPRPKRKTGKWPDEAKEQAVFTPIVYEDLDIVSADNGWYPIYSLIGRSGGISQEWALTANGQVQLSTYEGDKGWRDEHGQPLPNVIAYSPISRQGIFKTSPKPKRPPLQAGHWSDEPVPEWMKHSVLVELGTGQLKLPYDAWLPLAALSRRLHPQLGRWALLPHGKIQRLYPRRNRETDAVEWADLNDKVVEGVVAWAICKSITPPRLPMLHTGDWPTEEQAARARSAEPLSEHDQPVSVVIDADSGLGLRLPYGPWRQLAHLPVRQKEGDEELHGASIWLLRLDGVVVKATAEIGYVGEVRWRPEVDHHITKYVAWALYVEGQLPPESPPLYHPDSEDPRPWPTAKGYNDLKGPGAEKPDRLQWLADFLHDIVPGLSAAFSKKDDEEPVRLCAHPMTTPAFNCADYVKRPTVKEIAETVETARQADPIPVETNPPTSGDWTDGMYKTAGDYKVPPILETRCESTREFHEGIVRDILRDLINKETRDLTLNEYWDQMSPTEAYIMRGLLLGQEHFVDAHNPAATDYNRLYQSGFTTKVMVNFGPRLSQPYSGGGGSAGRGPVATGGGGGGGNNQYLWVLTELGRQFMSYLVAREHRAAVAKIPRP